MSKVTYLLGAGASYGSRGVLPLDKQPNISSDDFPPERGIIRGLPILQEFSNALNQLLGELTSIQVLQILMQKGNIYYQKPSIIF